MIINDDNDNNIKKEKRKKKVIERYHEITCNIHVKMLWV